MAANMNPNNMDAFEENMNMLDGNVNTADNNMNTFEQNMNMFFANNPDTSDFEAMMTDWNNNNMVTYDPSSNSHPPPAPNYNLMFPQVTGQGQEMDVEMAPVDNTNFVQEGLNQGLFHSNQQVYGPQDNVAPMLIPSLSGRIPSEQDGHVLEAPHQQPELAEQPMYINPAELIAQLPAIAAGESPLAKKILNPKMQGAKVEKKGKPKGKGGRKPKEATPDKVAREVRAFACQACRRKKTKCDGHVGQPCTACLKAKKPCVVDGKDRRTNNTNKDKCEKVRQELNDHLVKAALVCRSLSEQMTYPEKRGTTLVAGADCALKILSSEGFMPKPWQVGPILRPTILDDMTYQLADYRKAFQNYCNEAKTLTSVIGKLMIMLTHHDRAIRDFGRHFANLLVYQNETLAGPTGIESKIDSVLPACDDHFILTSMNEEINKLVASKQGI
ncbi:hypothetical protein CORC01_07651 [Colletotrichum orchidophilum]|uniref:Zn(2)-C6 fungal-type domain-containing protein n=1 Tax=Colletotrichum orchidophilum TaxID=1209926 RepID=A0A1G4B6Y0_9PEZI|nr:uncharacterized protein CORC01_07651 [Colletotrichum orchidophilum]OHE97042.1 hypothetical protein CORC01_07651 [Colletotrichum orchidophilum]